MKLKPILSTALAAWILALALASCQMRQDPDADPEQNQPKGDSAVLMEYTASGLGAVADVAGEKMSEDFVRSSANFGFSLLNNADPDGNMMLSPVSALYALGMTANGARGETLRQMEDTLFGGIAIEHANRYFRSFTDSLPQGKGVALQIADSVWINSALADFSVNAEFLSVNASYYDAGVFGLDFTSKEALPRVNCWVSDKTDGMIPNLLDQLSGEEVMILINTVLFDGKWKETYEDHAVRDAIFTSLDGTQMTREMLYSTEKSYFRLANGTGFSRPYADAYSFVGILPDEGVDVFEYAASLTGEAFLDALKNRQYTETYVCIPSFTFDYSTMLNGALTAMGMPDAFDEQRADFSGMGTLSGKNLCIGKVLQKTRIELSREGTKAAAATGVIVEATACVSNREPMFIYLTHPFLFAIVDNESGLPLFLGIVSELK